MIDKSKIVIRNSVETDDFKKIAKLIYSSDLNIYGAMFNDEMCAKKVLEELIPKNTINISVKNLVVAEYENSIVGMLCFIEDDYFDDKKAYKNAFSKLKIDIPKYFDEVFNVYWKKIINENFKNSYYISNVAVDKDYQNLGIGKMLLNYFKETHSDKPIGLDVVKNNESAINAYIKSGFKIVNKDNNDTSLAFRMVFDNK